MEREQLVAGGKRGGGVDEEKVVTKVKEGR
jgi:hypothetical protein